MLYNETENDHKHIEMKKVKKNSMIGVRAFFLD